VLGGGDGLAVREILRHPQVREVVLVDLDPEMTRLFTTHPRLAALNGGALRDPRVRVVNADAFRWLDEGGAGAIRSTSRSWTSRPVELRGGEALHGAVLPAARAAPAPGRAVRRAEHLAAFARRTYWSIVATLQAAGLGTWPYHVYVPSFGEWGYVLAGAGTAYAPPAALPGGLRFLTTTELPAMFAFATDMQPVPARPNRLNDQVLVRYYEEEWGRVNR
jgi:spermidine synthase